jgi:hypothetical protein
MNGNCINGWIIAKGNAYDENEVLLPDAEVLGRTNNICIDGKKYRLVPVDD